MGQQHSAPADGTGQTSHDANWPPRDAGQDPGGQHAAATSVAAAGTPTEGMRADLAPGGAPDRDDNATRLLAAASTGCMRSFEAFYRLTSRRTYAILLRINSNRDDAEELLQEVYLTVWREARQFDHRRGCAGQWLAVVARHRAIDSLRWRQARPCTEPLREPFADDGLAHAGSPTAQGDQHDPENCPALTLAHKRRAQAVRQALKDLPSSHRDSLNLAFHDGLSHREVAQRLGQPIGSVKSWIRRGLLTLRASVDDAA